MVIEVWKQHHYRRECKKGGNSLMYAIIKTGGKQYRVEVGTELEVEKLDAVVGAEVKIPTVASFGGKEVKTVTAKVLEHGKGEKLDIFTYKAKKNIRKRQGHRQPYTKIKILSI
jgi:large subunit ribosomal protein L21